MIMSIPDKNIIFEPLENPRGKKIIEYPLQDLYAVYIGDKDEIVEVAICKKEIDENNNIIYHDLLTNNIYKTEMVPLEINAIKVFTLTSLLDEKTRNTILKNGYITNFDLVDLYNNLNEDKGYETYPWRKDGVEHKAPVFAQTYEWNKPIIDEEENELIQLIASIKTNPKPSIIYGDKGIGKTALIAKLLYYAKNDNSLLDTNRIFILDYNNMLNKTRTIKHIKNRIKKSIDFIKNIDCDTLVIDNIDFKDKFFLDTITSIANEENIKLVLVSKNKKDIDLSNSKYNYIEVKEPKEEIKRQIFRLYLEEIEKKLKTKTDCFIEDIIDILIDADKTDCINTTNLTKNPKLGMQIIYNATLIASNRNIKKKKDKILTKEDFIKALDIDNINMDIKTKEEIKGRFKNLETKKEQKSFLKNLKRVNY